MDVNDFRCPNCKTEFPSDWLVDLCEEPFNGTLVECESCRDAWDLDLFVKYTQVG